MNKQFFVGYPASANRYDMAIKGPYDTRAEAVEAAKPCAHNYKEPMLILESILAVKPSYPVELETLSLPLVEEEKV